jgi:hypothetical protein
MIAFEKNLAFNAKKNRKLLYSYINDQKKVKDSIRCLINNGVQITDKLDIAECLNEQFCTVFTEPCSAKDFPTIEAITDKTCNIQLENFSPTHIQNELCKLDVDKSPGGDGIHPFVLKNCAPIIAKILSVIFTASFIMGIVPDAWKDANITPLFKKGIRLNKLNYRPISLTAIIGKVMEKLIQSPMINHLTRYDLISKSQHGFVKKKSCMTNLLETLDIITEIVNRGFSVDLIFLDFAKAFDMVSHAGLLVKLKSFGFDDQLINWMNSYLSGRRQRVVLGDIVSSWKEVLSGIPQGSILGPLLFLLFINDMPDLFNEFCKLFADDTKLLAAIRNTQDCNKLQSDLDIATIWAETWRMKFNNDKCKVMHIGKNNPLNKYTMLSSPSERTTLEETNAERDLGVILSKDLKWKCQVQKAANKANAILGILKRTFTHWTTETVKILYTSFVRPHLEYASSVWSPYQKQDIFTLEQVQRRATKLVPQLKNLPYEKRLELIGLTTLKERRERGDAIQFYKLKNGFNTIDWYHPNSLTNSINTAGPASGIRGHNQRYQRQFTRNCPSRENYFTNRTIPIWNSLPKEAIKARTVNEFKAKLDKFNTKY